MFLGVLITGIPFIVGIGRLLYFPFLPVGRENSILSALRHLTVYALICFTILVFDATLLIGGINFMPPYYFLNLAPFEWLRHPYEMGMERMASQLVLNILMFVPFGLLLPMVFRVCALLETLLAALGITVLIEVLQYFTGRPRTSTM